jgi:N6-L-threonylcarbamoyladenine synthase
MLILGIETSCDDTGVAIIQTPGKKQGFFKILSNVVSSQIKVHAKYGGVVPNLAAREHLKNIEPCLKTALKEAKVKPKDVDLIAVTIGPGLIPSLLIGVHFGKALAYVWNKPIVGVNHLEGHIIAALSSNSIQYSGNIFPAIALLVSGGHAQLILVKKIGDYKILGETRDDAAGECFDKIAKLLNLGYPGGPEIAGQAAKYKLRNTRYKLRLPRPMIDHKNYDFSFSGLKTAVLYKVKDPSSRRASMKKINVPEMCAEVQQAIIDVLIEKTVRAAKEYKSKTIILSGGVAANEELCKQLKSKIQNLSSCVQFFVPPKNLCTDNATMIAMAAYFNQKQATKNYNRIKANANLRI